MKYILLTPIIALSFLLHTACFSALPPEGEKSVPKPVEPGAESEAEEFESAYKQLQIDTPTQRNETPPLVLAHYMPWYKGPSTKNEENALGNYGGHWTGWGKIDPTRTNAGGMANIASHHYPLTGPYHSANTVLLEYQAALMKIAGIDGVIFDWYGSYHANDFGEIHGYTTAMVAVLKRAGLKFLVCYEDNTLTMMDKDGAEADSIGKQSFDFAQANWFGDASYVKYQNRPVALCFGPQHFKTKTRWDTVFSGVNPEPWFVSLSGAANWTDASYNWPAMSGVKSISALVKDLNDFYRGQKDKPWLAASAWPAFDDIYAQIGGTSYGSLVYAEGETFKLTFFAAQQSRADIIQIATWNDYGEGTIIEPTVERGYRELEYLRDKRKEREAGFPWTAEDLRWPLEFYKLLYSGAASAAQKTAIRAAIDAVFAGNAAAFRAEAAKTGASVSVRDLKPLLRK